MHVRDVRMLLDRLRRGTISTAKAIDRLRHMPYEDLGFAKLDNHRQLRRGFPEVVYGEGKSVPQIVAIMRRMALRGHVVLVTRVTPEVHRKVRARLPGTRYHAEARAMTLNAPKRPSRTPGILVLAAGTSDVGVAEEAALTAEMMGHEVVRAYDVGIAGLHRLLDQRDKLSRARVIIAVAGMEGALPSVVAGLVGVPVIGVPTSVGYGTGLKGVAALMSMLNSCATGLVVVNIDNGFGAGYAAAVMNSSLSNKSL